MALKAGWASLISRTSQRYILPPVTAKTTILTNRRRTVIVDGIVLVSAAG